MAEAEILGPNEEMSMVPVGTQELDPQTRSEINLQVQFAMDHPRRMEKVLAEIESLSCLSQEVAEEMFYTLKRKDFTGAVKLIQGPSIRFAEILIYCYRNTRGDKGISNIGAEDVTGKGVFFDLERNNAMKVETRRRILDKNNRRYNVDMIQMTGNAASSLAFRNAVTAIIPQALWKPKLKKAMVVAIGGTQSISDKRNAAIEYGKKIGVSPEQIFDTLGIQGINDMGMDELISLKGLFNTVKDGEATVEEAFGNPYEKEITALMDQAQWTQPKREMVVKDYRGRSLDLLARLRKEVEPLNVGQAQTAKGEGQATPTDQTSGDFIRNNEEQKTETKPEATEQTKKAGRPKKDTPVVDAVKESEPSKEPEQNPVMQAETKPEVKPEPAKTTQESVSDDLFSKF